MAQQAAGIEMGGSEGQSSAQPRGRLALSTLSVSTWNLSEG